MQYNDIEKYPNSLKGTNMFMINLLLACSSMVSSVNSAGELRQIMHQSDSSAKINLSTLTDHKHLYALGALEGLKGEILIEDSNLLVSSEGPNGIELSTNWDVAATLLVYAQVEKWRTISIPNTVQSKTDLETFIGQQARKTKSKKDSSTTIDQVPKPFAFRLTGEATLDWHVINWTEGENHSHQSHIESGLSGRLHNESVAILGFYSTAHQAIWTHHSSNVHMHFKNEDATLSGHVDDITVEKMMLWLPK